MMTVYRISNYCDYNGGRVLDVITEDNKITAFSDYSYSGGEWDVPNPTIGEHIKSFVRRWIELTEGDYGHAEPVTKVTKEKC